MTICEPSSSALVLGRAQPAEHVDREAAARLGLDVVRRESGGGAVLVAPGDLVWVDVLVPLGDPRWHDDVGLAFAWLGEAWAAALAACGVAGAQPHEGAMVRSRWSDRACFAGVGPGEVMVGGRKVVGLAQRRTRAWVRFHGAAVLRWDVEALVSSLALEEAARAAARRDLAAVAAPAGVEPAALEAALLAELATR